MNNFQIEVNHEEFIRDYAGYEFVQDEMETTIKRFLAVYFKDILALYGCQAGSSVPKVEVSAAGAGASKFVFGAIDEEMALVFGIRMYNSKGFMRDRDKIYESAEAYKVNLETCDQELVEIIIDEIRIYDEFEKYAKTGIDVRRIWTRFPVDKEMYQNTAYHQYIDKFVYIADRELKRLLVNLGITAITVGGFVVGYDGRKILEREEYQPEYQQDAIIHICNALLKSWLFTVRYDNNKIVGRSIVDLKPAQFVVQSDNMKNDALMPAVVIDVGPAENTDDIYTYVKDITYMKELVVAFASQMLGKISLSKSPQAKQYVYEGIINHLNECKQSGAKPKMVQEGEFFQLVDELVAYMMTKVC